jgi:hypothetical protein
MTLSDLASLATVLSGAAVLASLIYLAQQTRQNTRHTRALIEQARVPADHRERDALRQRSGGPQPPSEATLLIPP